MNEDCCECKRAGVVTILYGRSTKCANCNKEIHPALVTNYALSKLRDTERPTKFYLGDGVYATQVRDSIVLTVEDGESVLHTVVLEPEVLQAFLDYIHDTSDNFYYRL